MRYDDENPTRAPLPPPFPVGTKLRCIDKKGSVCRFGKDGIRHPKSDSDFVTIYGYGLVVTIDKMCLGRRGTGREVDLDDGGETFIDSTRDGYSVYHVEGTHHGRCISPEDAHKWKAL